MEHSLVSEIEAFGALSFITLIVKFVFDFIVVFILTRYIYFTTSKNKSYMFTLIVFNITIFFVCVMLNNLTLSIGFSFGIFALFSVLRYRTSTIPIKEMTYLFVAISIAVINSLINPFEGYAELLFTNAMILFITFLLEKIWIQNELVKYITYEKIELVKPENRAKLLEDLEKRTGLKINRIEIGKIDFLRDVSEIRVYYNLESGSDFNSTDLYSND